MSIIFLLRLRSFLSDEPHLFSKTEIALFYFRLLLLSVSANLINIKMVLGRELSHLLFQTLGWLALDDGHNSNGGLS